MTTYNNDYQPASVNTNRNKEEEEFSLSLSTMPFESLRDLLNETNKSGHRQSKADMCRLFVEQNILISISSTLSSISHHPHKKTAPHFNHSKLRTASLPVQEQNNNLYWTKGTGFGYGSTAQHWDPKKTMIEQKVEEEQVVLILDVSFFFPFHSNENFY